MWRFWPEITWKSVFISNMHTWKNTIVYLKKLSHLGTGSYCLWNIVFVEKNWTLVNYISRCLIWHITIWIKFISTVDFLNIYFLLCNLLGICKFQSENARKIAFLNFLITPPYLEHRNRKKSMWSVEQYNKLSSEIPYFWSCQIPGII